MNTYLKRSNMAYVLARGSHSFTYHPHTNHIPAFTLQPQSIAAFDNTALASVQRHNVHSKWRQPIIVLCQGMDI